MRFRWLSAVIVLSLVFFAGACGDDDDSGVETVRFWVAAETVECMGVAPQTCLQVREDPDGDYELFYTHIEGFQHVEGMAYVLDVEVTEVPDPPADGSSLAYRLIRIVETSGGG